MADGKIYIIVTDRLPGGGGEPLPDKPRGDTEKEKEGVLSSFAKHKFFDFIQDQTKQAINYSIGNIGNFTGDYIAQTHAAESIHILNSVMNIGVAAYTGFKTTGSPWGALVAAGISVASMGISAFQEVFATQQQIKRQNRDIDLLRSRSGLNSTNNESRGTEY